MSAAGPRRLESAVRSAARGSTGTNTASRRRSGGGTTGAQDLESEVHDEPHAEARRAVGIVRARDIALQRRQRHVVVAAVLPADLVHEDVTARLERAADGDDTPVDAR